MPANTPRNRPGHTPPGISLEAMTRHAGEAAGFLKLLANPHRLLLLCHLIDGEQSVSELNRYLPISQSALSQHLAVLREAGVVATRREQQTIYYRLASERVEAVIGELHRQFCHPG